MVAYRVENPGEGHGIWRNFDGSMNPVFDNLSDGLCKDLPMEDNDFYRFEGKQWFSATDTPEKLCKWFSARDVVEMESMGYHVFKFEVDEWRPVSEFEIVFTRDSITDMDVINPKEIWGDAYKISKRQSMISVGLNPSNYELFNPLVIIDGDLMNTTCKCIMHQVNCRGEMNSGVAKCVRETYPECFKEYASKASEDMLGKSLNHYSYNTNDSTILDKVIMNVFGQSDYGYDGEIYTIYTMLLSGIIDAIHNYRSSFNVHGHFSIAIPYKMSCDRGGADWDTVFNILRSLQVGLNVSFIAYRLPVKVPKGFLLKKRVSDILKINSAERRECKCGLIKRKLFEDEKCPNCNEVVSKKGEMNNES